MRASFQTKLISAPSGVRKKFPWRGLKFCCTVTPQINITESAEGKTIVGWYGGMLRKKFAKYSKNTRFRAFWKQVLE